MESIILEQFLNESPEPLSIKSIETILEQMKNSICKIYIGKQGTGFFMKIPFNNTQLPVLITSNHIINENDYINNKIITIYLGNESKGRNIKLDNKRKFYTNKEYDTTIIEIKEDIDGIKNFLELDDKLKECLSMNKDEIPEFLKNIYLNKSLYILNYPEGKEIVASIAQPGKIIDQYINHKCNTKTGSSGSPILLCENQKVIGVHLGYSNKLKFNKGMLIIYSIIDFNQEHNKYKYKYNKSIDLIHNDNENSILGKNESINEKINITEIQKKAEKYMKNIKLMNFLDNRFIEKNKINCELENIEYEENWTKNEFNIEKIGEAAYKLYEMCKDIKKGIPYDGKKYFKLFKYDNIDLIFDNIFNIENIEKIGSTPKIGVSCKIKNPLSDDLSKIPLLIFSSDLLGKKFIIKNKKTENLYRTMKELINIELNDDSIYYKDKYIIIIKCNYLMRKIFDLFLNISFIYLDDLNDINIKEINFNQNTSLNQNEILLFFKINFSDINKKIYFIYNEKRYLYESIIEGEENNNHKKYFIAKKEGIYKVKLIFKNTIENCNNMFCNLENLFYVDLSHLDTKNVNDMSFMFYYCENLKGINLSSFNTQNVSDMSYMFCGCYRLEKIDLSYFKTDNVLDMKSMFMFCKALKKIDLKSFNTSKVRSMRSMFKYCISLEDVNLLSFQTENVRDMKYMFQNYDFNLKRIDLSSFNFKSLTSSDMELMFSGAYQEIFIKKNSYFTPSSNMFFRHPNYKINEI